MNKRLTFTEAKQIPITDWLEKSGFESSQIRGDDHWYYSPFREERTPSFKVNSRLNLWYDHGIGEGGTILDLGAKLFQCSLVEFLHRLEQENISGVIRTPVVHKPELERKLQILSVGELQNQDLLQYLNQRGISNSVSNNFCKEVEFSIRDRSYTAIGFENQSGAWELRNRWFKGSSAPKDITFIDSGNDKLIVLEGFMDFLSLQTSEHSELLKIRSSADFLILNSLRLLNRSIPLIGRYSETRLLLDNDQAARDAKENLIMKGIGFSDGSPLYSGFKDLNEFHVDELKQKPRKQISNRKMRL